MNEQSKTFLDPLPTNPPEPVEGGEFGEWLTLVLNELEDRTGIDVPCGDCSACCRSSMFIHVRADEHESRAAIGPELLFPAPGNPDVSVLGYDENGHCPMFRDNQCSIYDVRPETCRTFDCRLFAATGKHPSDPARRETGERTLRWQFRYDDPQSERLHRAALTARRFLDEHPEVIPVSVTADETQLSLLSLKLTTLFLETARQYEETGVMESSLSERVRYLLDQFLEL